MGGSPPPRGVVVGNFRVIHKSNAHADKTVVTLAGENGTCVFRVNGDDKDYFVEGEVYQISATQP